MKDKIIELLTGDTLKDYLAGIESFKTELGSATLPDSDLDQELIERVCAVLVYERWGEHSDYIEGLQHIINTLPNYSNLISDEKVGHYIRGIAMFVNGLGKGELDVSGFIYPSHSGYLMSYTAGEQIQEYLEGKGEKESAEYFKNLGAFFEQFNSAQFSVIRALMDIKTWNESMAAGFYNIMTASDIGTQSWMLGSLYKVIKDPVVKKDIFGKYKEVLNQVKNKYSEAGEESNVSQIDTIIEMVVEKSKGN